MKKSKKPLAESELSEDPYDSDNIDDLLEDDEITSEEAGFMEGYNAKQKIKPKKMKKILTDK